MCAEKARQEQEKEEKRKNTFRIPKKVAVEEQPSDAESFSSISSDEDANNTKTAQQGSSEKSHKSSSHAHSHSKDKHSSSEKSSKQSSSHSSKSSSKEHSSKHSDNHSKTDRSGHSSSDKHSTEKDKSGSSKTHKSSSKKEHSHSSSSKERTPGSSKDRPDGSSKSHSHSSSSKEHAHSSSNKDRSSSSNKSHSHGSSSKEHSSSNKEHRHGSSKSHSGSSKTQDKSRTVSKEKLSGVTLNDSSGYVTSPSLNSESDDDERPSKSRSQKHSSKSELPSNHYRTEAMKQEENSDMPVVLTRHHLNPTIQRQGGALEDRMKMLEKLKAIRERMADDDPGYSRKRAAKGEVKKRRAKREKLEGDFTGSCMEKINYEEEEKPSLKRPEPKPEEFKPEKPVKQKPLKMHNRNKLIKSREKSSGSHKIKSDSKSSSKVNRFDAMHEKPKKKPKPHPRPPPVNFADLMKMAEQRQAEPVMVEVAPKKEKEKRPMTQEEIDRKHAREERLKTKEYKDWYKYGENAKTSQQKSALDENSEAQSSGGFVRRDHNVMPSSGASSSQSKSSFSIPRKSDVSSSGKGSVSVSSSSRPAAPEPTAARASGSKSQPHPTPGSKPQPHPTRPGMIANKPRAMAQHMNSQNKSSEPERPRSEQKARVGGPSREPPSQPRPQAAKVVDKTKGGNAWDSLFSRPEYTKLKQHPGLWCIILLVVAISLICVGIVGLSSCCKAGILALVRVRFCYQSTVLDLLHFFLMGERRRLIDIDRRTDRDRLMGQI